MEPMDVEQPDGQQQKTTKPSHSTATNRINTLPVPDSRMIVNFTLPHHMQGMGQNQLNRIRIAIPQKVTINSRPDQLSIRIDARLMQAALSSNDRLQWNHLKASIDNYICRLPVLVMPVHTSPLWYAVSSGISSDAFAHAVESEVDQPKYSNSYLMLLYLMNIRTMLNHRFLVRYTVYVCVCF